jgi:ethanolamine ammonia-lyase large subunit
MLGYQSLSYHDMITLRHQFKRQPAPEFGAWLKKMGMTDDTGRLAPQLTSGGQARTLLSYEVAR